MPRRARCRREEWDKLPLLARGAALRFLLTRLVDWLDVPPGALVRPKDPIEYLRKLRFHQKVKSARDYGVMSAVTAQLPHVVVQPTAPAPAIPGPADGARSSRFGDHEKELKGGEATTNNRMELMAAISALEALKRPCRVDLHTDSQYLRNGITVLDGELEAQRLAHLRQKAGEEHRSVAAARCGALCPIRCDWHWVRGHAGHALNERADVLARAGDRRNPQLIG